MQRICFREPIPEIFESAKLLDTAVVKHLEWHFEAAHSLIVAADIPEISEWVESILGKKSPYIQFHSIDSSPPILQKNMRIPIRMPNKGEKQKIHKVYWYCCQFCGIPVVRPEIRDRIRRQYPDALRWGKTNASRHAGFFALWAQYDHIVPHARGGDNSFENLILTCSACNSGRMNYMLEEVWIMRPSFVKKPPIDWNWLENFI